MAVLPEATGAASEEVCDIAVLVSGLYLQVPNKGGQILY